MEFNEVSKILREVFLQYGNELFTNEKRLKAVLSDLLPSFPKEKRLIEYAVDEGIVATIASNPRAISHDYTQALAEQLSENYAITPDASGQVVNAVVYAVRGKTVTNKSDTHAETNHTNKTKSTAASEYSIKFKNASQGKTANTARERSTKDSEYHYKYNPAQNRSQAGKEPTNERNSTRKTTQGGPENGSAEYRIKFKQDARQQHSNDIKTNAASGKTTIKETHIPNSSDAIKHLNRRILIDVLLLLIVMPLILMAVGFIVDPYITEGQVEIIMPIFGIIDLILIWRIIHNVRLKRRHSKH